MRRPASETRPALIFAAHLKRQAETSAIVLNPDSFPTVAGCHIPTYLLGVFPSLRARSVRISSKSHRHLVLFSLTFKTRKSEQPTANSFTSTNPHQPECRPDSATPESTEVTYLPVTVVSASTGSTPVVVVWLVVSTTTGPTSTRLVGSQLLGMGGDSAEKDGICERDENE